MVLIVNNKMQIFLSSHYLTHYNNIYRFKKKVIFNKIKRQKMIVEMVLIKKNLS